MNRKATFTDFYRKNRFGGRYSKSGPGSEGVFAELKKDILRRIIDAYEIDEIVDLGCGDLFWMRELLPNIPCYHGIDIVPELIEEHKKEFLGTEGVHFTCQDIIEEHCYVTDLMICFDVFLHLFSNEIEALLGILERSSWRYLLITNRRGGKVSGKSKDTRWQRIDLPVYYPDFFQENKLKLVEAWHLVNHDYAELYERDSE